MSEYQAELPYAGTSGHAGTDTSAERALAEDTNGTTAARQLRVLNLLGHHQEFGMTVSELRAATGWHHGQASGPLSVLHKVGKVARLTTRRGRCKVYVLPEYVNGRTTEGYARNKNDDYARGFADGFAEGLHVNDV